MSYLIIQDCISYQVIGEEGRWIRNRAEALRFRTADEAIEYCQKHKIEAYTLMNKFDDASAADSKSKSTMLTLLTLSAQDSAYALSAFYNAFASAA